MKSWKKHRPSAKVSKRQDQIIQICNVVTNIWDTYYGDNNGRHFGDIPDSVWKEIRSIRSDTGLNISVAGEIVELRDGVTCLLRQEARGIADKRAKKREIAKIVQATKRTRWDLEHLRKTLDRVSSFSSQAQCERLVFDLADAMDRHEARISHALPNLRSKASYVMLFDPLVIAAQTVTVAGYGSEVRSAMLKAQMTGWNPSSDRLPFKGARRIGNIVLSDLGDYKEHEGRILVKQAIPEAVRAAMKGRLLEELVGNHPAKGMGVKITQISSGDNDDDLVIHTTAESHHELIPIEIY